MIQPDIRSALAAMPVSLEPKYSVETKRLYAPHLAGANDGVTATLDETYGPHARHRLDVYRVPGQQASAIVIYVPGGGYTGGDKRSDDVVFANIGSTFARRGMLGVTMNYRLAPEVQWPSGAQDVASAVVWVKANAARFDANPNRIVLFGHSAGASHCASFLFDPELRGDRQVAGGVLVSGAAYSLTADDIDIRANFRAYFGEDRSATQLARRSAVNHVAGTKVPVLLGCAEHDPGGLVTPTLELAIALTKRDGRCPPLLRLEGHNHFSPPCSIGSSDDELGGAITRFVQGLT